MEFEKSVTDFILNGEIEEAKLLAADPNCDVNWASNDDWSPLITASFDGYHDVVKVLLGRQDLLINYQNNNGDSALIEASAYGNTKCVELLVIDSRTDVNLTNINGRTALYWAFKKGHLAIMKLLISHGANARGVLKTLLVEKLIISVSVETFEVMENWKLYLPEFTRVAKTNKYYPSEFKEWAFNFILCCLRSKSFPKDIIYLLLEYIARAWKRIRL